MPASSETVLLQNMVGLSANLTKITERIDALESKLAAGHSPFTYYCRHTIGSTPTDPRFLMTHYWPGTPGGAGESGASKAIPGDVASKIDILLKATAGIAPISERTVSTHSERQW